MMVHSLLTRTPTTAQTAQMVLDVSKLMTDENAGAVIILDDERLVGIVTDRDIVTQIPINGAGLLHWPVSRIMTPDPFTCFEDQDVNDAAAIMADNQVRRLPALNRANRLVGLLSLDNIAVHYSEHIAGEVLGEIVEFRKKRPAPLI